MIKALACAFAIVIALVPVVNDVCGLGCIQQAAATCPLHPDAPQLEGTGEIRLESTDRASGYFTTRGDQVNTRTSGVYVRADPTHMSILDGGDNQKRLELIADRLNCWKSMKST